MANFSLARIFGIGRGADEGSNISSINEDLNSNQGSLIDDELTYENPGLVLQQEPGNMSSHENDYNNYRPSPSAPPLYDSGPNINVSDLGARPKTNTPREDIPFDQFSSRQDPPDPINNKLEDMALRQKELELTINKLKDIITQTNISVNATDQAVTDIRKDYVKSKPKHKSILASMYECPTFGADFKPSHSLSNIKENRYIKEVFSSNINKKFSGIIKNDVKTDYSVIRFLRDMSNSQSMVKLSEKEFLMMLKSRCDPPAYNDVSIWCEQNITAADLYERMVNMFKGHVDPVKALHDLSSYKIPINYSFIQAVSEITALAHTASYIELDPAARLGQENTLIMTHLLRSMPAEAKRYISEITLDYVREEGKSPTIHNIYSALMERNDLLDNALKTSASKHLFGPHKNYGQNNPSSKKHQDAKEEKSYNGEGHKNKGNANKVKGRGLNKIIAQNEPIEGQTQIGAAQALPVQVNSTQAQPPYSHTSNNGPSRPRNNFSGNNNSSNTGRKMFCSGCGMTNHTLTGERGCFALVDDNLKRVVAPTPAFGRCSECFDKLGIELRHQKVVCPLREKLISSYRSGKLTARGPIADYLKKKNIIP